MPRIGMHIGLRYDIIGEYASLLLALLLLIFMSLTKPKKSKSFKFLVMGLFASIVATTLQIVIVEVASNVTSYYNRESFTVLLAMFLFVYAVILVLIFNYINLLSERRLRKRSVIIMLYIAVSLFYFSGTVFQIAMKSLYYVRTDGIDISQFTRFYCLMGIFCAIVCFIVVMIRRRSIARIVIRGVCIVVPLVILVLFLRTVHL